MLEGPARPIVGRRYRIRFGTRQPREIVGTLHGDFVDADGRWLRFVQCEVIDGLPMSDHTILFASISELREQAR